MKPLTDRVANSSNLNYPEQSFSIGLRELLFLTMIFFFGFCGFSICVNTIYMNQTDPKIDSITVHEKDYSVVSNLKSALPSGN